ncbi:MAG: hypothetical protein K2X87_02915 [Gemmataceae bacterium]|nr:hypothetical protein [Gemmataceae bacterium]
MSTKPQPSKGAEPSDTPRKGPVARAGKAVASAAGTVAEAVVTAAQAAQQHVVRPVAEAVGLAKKPKSAATPKGKTAAGKVMSKKVAAVPAKAGKTRGPAAKKPAAGELRKKMPQPARRRGR